MRAVNFTGLLHARGDELTVQVGTDSWNNWYLAADSITDYPVVNDSIVLPSVSK
ncbi:hypothetical protein ACLBWT_11950 [Paenibacillus sp. D51F]